MATTFYPEIPCTTDHLPLDTIALLLPTIDTIWGANNEAIHIGEFYKKSLNFQQAMAPARQAFTNYISKGSFSIDDPYKLNDLFASGTADQDFDHAYFIAKLTWLFDNFVRDNLHWRHPICIHWNPRIKEYVIHPGFSRGAISLMYGPDFVCAYLFNTGGHEDTAMRGFEPIAASEVQAQHRIILCADHATLIPHIAPDDLRSQQEGALYWHMCINKRFARSRVRINMNYQDDFLFPRWSNTSDPDIVANVEWKGGPNEIVEDYYALKTFIAIAANREWDDNEIKVTYET